MTRVILALCGAVAATGCASKDASPQNETLGVIEAVPDGHVGEWRIGGRSFLATTETRLDDEHPAMVGRLAEVEFRMENGTAVAVGIEPHAFEANDLFDGPHVFWRGPDTFEAIAVEGSRAIRKARHGVRSPLEVRLGSGVLPVAVVDPTPPAVPPARWPAPSRLLAISDLEGNHAALLAYLKTAGVLDADGHWQWGDGHLLFNGDIVDRGDRVTEILWLIRRLEREARAAGGHVHYVLGNHETMVMAGDLRYVHPKYRWTSRLIGISYEDLHGSTTEIGRWWRTRNSVVKIGRLLFVHAGYSPALDALGHTLPEINDKIRARLDQPKPKDRSNLSETLAWSRQGPLWYRGYFRRYGDDYGPPPSDEAIDAILRRHQVDHIVVGHSVVDDVGWLDPKRRLIAIDVKWAEPGEAEGLLLEGGRLYRLGPDGVRRSLTMQQGAPSQN